MDLDRLLWKITAILPRLRPCQVRYTGGMEVYLPPDVQARLDMIAKQQGRDASALVSEAVERFVRSDDWLIREVKKGLEAADRGEFIDHEEVGKLIDSRYPG